MSIYLGVNYKNFYLVSVLKIINKIQNIKINYLTWMFQYLENLIYS